MFLANWGCILGVYNTFYQLLSGSFWHTAGWLLLMLTRSFFVLCYASEYVLFPLVKHLCLKRNANTNKFLQVLSMKSIEKGKFLCTRPHVSFCTNSAFVDEVLFPNLKLFSMMCQTVEKVSFLLTLTSSKEIVLLFRILHLAIYFLCTLTSNGWYKLVNV